MSNNKREYIAGMDSGTEKREYHIVMDSLTAITVMQSLDVIVSGTDNEQDAEMLLNVGNQIDNEHTRFLNDPIKMESNMTTEKKPIDVAVDSILHDRLVTELAFKVIMEAGKLDVTEQTLIEEVEDRMRDMIRERMDRDLTKG